MQPFVKHLSGAWWASYFRTDQEVMSQRRNPRTSFSSLKNKPAGIKQEASSPSFILHFSSWLITIAKDMERMWTKRTQRLTLWTPCWKALTDQKEKEKTKRGEPTRDKVPFFSFSSIKIRLIPGWLSSLGHSATQTILAWIYSFVKRSRIDCLLIFPSCQMGRPR